jgi:hypothetical protein
MRQGKCVHTQMNQHEKHPQPIKGSSILTRQKLVISWISSRQNQDQTLVR